MALKDRFNTNSNIIYKITQDIDLEGSSITLGSNTTLDFQGGSIKNGIIGLNKTHIKPNGCVITNYISATIQGSYAIGQCLFDPTINKPKWWDGTKWIDANGQAI